jgi:hypothetical protein
MNKEERKAKFLELLELFKDLETTILAGDSESFQVKDKKEDISIQKLICVKLPL